MSISSFPLVWPPGVPRSKRREKGQFRTELNTALNNVRKSLLAFAADSGKKLEAVVISSNVESGISFNPNRGAGGDPGIALWFTWDGLPVCVAVDRYETVASNLQAVHLIIESRRVELRHGTLAMVRATFSGFKALPPPPGQSWREVLGITAENPMLIDVEIAYKKLANLMHPDKPGGSHERMAQLNKARDTALQEIG